MSNLETTRSGGTQADEHAQRRLVGYALMGAIVPFVILIATIVAIRFPPWWMIAATVLCWMIFFAGKTIVKSLPPANQTAASDD